MKKKYQTSESLLLGIILALSGGFMDSYSYIERGRVFANAQTGNILLFGVNLSEGNFTKTLNYLFPVLAFAFGIFLAEIVRSHAPEFLHWRQTAVLAEALILIVVAFFPLTMNRPANALTSFACGIQVECFRKIRGRGIATTMCIGNLRSGTDNLHRFLSKRDPSALHNCLIYYGIILFFICGAVIGNFIIGYLHEKSIMVCSVFLLTAFVIMFIDSENTDKKPLRL